MRKEMITMLFTLVILQPIVIIAAIPLPNPSGLGDFNKGIESGSRLASNMMQMQNEREMLRLEQERFRLEQEKIRGINGEKLYQYIQIAQLGDPESAFRVGNIFNERITFCYTKEEYKNTLISSLAWYKVSSMLGMKTLILNNGDIVDMSVFLDNCKKKDYLDKKELKKADEMAFRICSNIPKCAQRLKLQG